MKLTGALAALLLAAGCASAPASDAPPTFKDIPAGKPMQLEVTVTSRLADAATVRSTCYMRAREGGLITKPHASAPACSWREPDGRIVLLWANPKSFNNHVGIESGGHELFHWHEEVDHE